MGRSEGADCEASVVEEAGDLSRRSAPYVAGIVLFRPPRPLRMGGNAEYCYLKNRMPEKFRVYRTRTSQRGSEMVFHGFSGVCLRAQLWRLLRLARLLLTSCRTQDHTQPRMSTTLKDGIQFSHIPGVALPHACPAEAGHQAGNPNPAPGILARLKPSLAETRPPIR